MPRPANGPRSMPPRYPVGCDVTEFQDNSLQRNGANVPVHDAISVKKSQQQGAPLWEMHGSSNECIFSYSLGTLQLQWYWKLGKVNYRFLFSSDVSFLNVSVKRCQRFSSLQADRQSVVFRLQQAAQEAMACHGHVSHVGRSMGRMGRYVQVNVFNVFLPGRLGEEHSRGGWSRGAPTKTGNKMK